MAMKNAVLISALLSFSASTYPAQASTLSGNGDTTVFLGDSITAFGNALENMGSDTFGWGWTAQAVFLSKGRIQQVYNAGIPGNTLVQMLARFPTDVVAYHPAKVVIAGGTNDLPSVPYTSSTLAGTISVLTSIINDALAAGIEPIICGIPPRVDSPVYQANAPQLDTAIKNLAASMNLVFVDMYSVLAQKNGTFKTGYNLGDGVHPSVIGATAMANAFVSTTAMVYGSSVYLPWVNTSPDDLVANALFLNPIGSTWAAGYGTAPAPNVTIVGNDSTIVGNWMQLSFPPATAAGQSYYYSYNYDNVTANSGDNYELSFRFKISGLEANGGTVAITYGYSGPTVAYNIKNDVVDGTFNLVSTAVNKQLNPGFVVYPTTNATHIVISVAQVGLRDVTAP